MNTEEENDGAGWSKEYCCVSTVILTSSVENKSLSSKFLP